jgi:hypothetical protein
MSLPNLSEDFSFTKRELPCGKKIGIKSWKVKEERELLFAIEGQRDTAEGRKEIVKMMRKCVDNTSLFDSLSSTNYVYLVTELRKLSKGTKIEYNYVCTNPKCKLPLSDDVDLLKDIEIVKFSGGVKKINDNLTFCTKEVSFVDFEMLKETYEKVTEYNYNYVLRSIDSFTFKGDTFTEFTEEELITAIDSMTSNDYEILTDFVLNSISSITINRNLECKRCGKVMKIEFGDLYYFLAL